MAEHIEITEKLNEGQVNALAADITRLSQQEYADAGVPKVRFIAADEASGGAYPSYKAMANSWNKELLKTVWEDAAGICREDAEVMISPAAGTGITPYSACAAEDPSLAEGLMQSFAYGVKKAGLTPCISCGMPNADNDYLDDSMRARVLNELYVSAYGSLPEGTAFTFPYAQSGEDYSDALIPYLKDRDGAIICSDVPDKRLEDCLKNGILLKDGSADRLTENIGGTLTQRAAKRAVDFAFTSGGKSGAAYAASAAKTEKTARTIAEQSCVLIKNDSALPIRNNTNVAVMGGLSEDVNARALCDVFKTAGKYIASYAKGYEPDGGIDTGLTDSAVQTARGAKCTIVFLGFNKRLGERSCAQRRAKLPAVQLALLDKLAALNTRIIAVVGADYPVDLSFDGKADAIIVCPSSGKYTAQALYNVITGKVSPSGRLAQTWYRNADGHFRLLKNELAAGTRKTGLFTGYRDYVTSGEEQPYPFGFGLSYTKFEYSALSIRKNEIKFKVRNTGQYSAGEVVQVYIGKNDSAILRPQMQLKAFTRVFLKSGESTVCTVKCTQKTFEVFSGGKFTTEKGKYNVYIGSSSRDIRLKGTIYSDGASLLKDNVKRYSYDTSQSNILAGGYAFGEVKKSKRFGKSILKVGILLFIAVILAALILAPLQIGGYINFAYMDWWAKFGITCISSVTAAAVLFTLIGGIALMVSNGKKEVSGKGGSGVNGKVAPSPYEQLFEKLYGPEEYDEYVDEGEYSGYGEPVKKAAEDGNGKTEQAVVYEPAAEAKPAVEEAKEQEFVGKYDRNITYDDLCGWLNTFIESKGITIGRGGARKVLSSFASSRLVILDGAARFTGSFASALSEYFTGTVYGCDLAAIGEGSLFTDGAFTSALQHAEENPDDMVLITLSGADDGTAAHITPFIRCAYAKERIKVQSGGNSAVIPANVWFVILPSKELFGFSDKLLCRVSAVLLTELNRCDTPSAGEYARLNFEQFRSMNDRIITYDEDYRYSLDEENCWKRVDAIEKYLNGASGYVLDNRDMLSMERYAAVYLACGGEQNDALDNVVAVKMVLPAMQALKAAGVKDDDFVALLEGRFVDYDDIKKVINYLR